VFLRSYANFHFCPGHWMWLGQFWGQPNSNTNSGNYTIADSGSNSQRVANSYTFAHAESRFCHYWPSG
jgi:hypothetical protein